MSTHAQGVGQEPYDRWLMCWFLIIYIYLGEWREARELLLLQGRKIQKSQKKVNLKKMAVISFVGWRWGVVLVVTNRYLGSKWIGGLAA